MYNKKIPDDGQRNCPKHVEFYSKNKFEKLVHIVSFFIRNYHDARSPEYQINIHAYSCNHFCSGKTIIITYSDCVFLVLLIQHGKLMRQIILSSVVCRAVPYFSTLY